MIALEVPLKLEPITFVDKSGNDHDNQWSKDSDWLMSILEKCIGIFNNLEIEDEITCFHLYLSSHINHPPP